MIPDAVLQSLVTHIKAKKGLGNLDDKFVRKKVKEWLEKNQRHRKKLKHRAAQDPGTVHKSKEYAEVMKSVRKELREVYGVFIMDTLAGKSIAGTDESLLQSHRSSAERLSAYSELYARIFLPHATAWKGRQLRIVDLGCGMNPASYRVLSDVLCQRPAYEACDVSSADVAFLNEFFKARGIPGTATRIDLSEEREFRNLDLRKKKGEFLACFLFKLVDTLESQQRQVSKKLILYLSKHADLIAITFPTKSLGGKKGIREEKRRWLDGFLRANKLRFETFTVGEELVYVVRC